MKIGFEILGIPGKGITEGQAKYGFYLIKDLLKLKTKHDFFLFYNSWRQRRTFKEIAEALGTENFRLIQSCIPFTDHFYFSSFMKYLLWRRLARTQRLDIFHGTSYMGLSGSDPPSVITVHDIATVLFPFIRKPGKWRSRIIKEIDRVSHVITPSEHTKRDLVTFWGIGEEKITSIPEGCIISGINQDVVNTDIRFKISEHYILYVGSFRYNKNVPRLLKAFALFSNRCLDVELVLAGDGGDLKEMRHLAVDLNLEDKVHFLGYVQEECLDYLYREAMALFSPSLYEGFGLTMLEAMGRGCPVAASRSASIPEVVGDAGLLFDPLDIEDMAEKMIRLASDKNLRRDLSERGKKRAALFTWERSARKTLEVYEKCVRKEVEKQRLGDPMNRGSGYPGSTRKEVRSQKSEGKRREAETEKIRNSKFEIPARSRPIGRAGGRNKFKIRIFKTIKKIPTLFSSHHKR